MGHGKDFSAFHMSGRYLEALHGGFSGWVRDCMIAGVSWLPGLAGTSLRSMWSRIWLQGAGGFVMERGVRVLGAQHIRVERGVFIDRGVYLHGRPGGLHLGAGARLMQGAVLHVYNFRGLSGSGISIGRDCVIGMNACITGQGGVRLGDNVIVAPGAMILAVEHRYEESGRPIREQGIEAKGIEIKDGAWIGAGSVILDGVTMAENAVAGAGSVVTRDVGPGEVVAGNPARPVTKSERESQ